MIDFGIVGKSLNFVCITGDGVVLMPTCCCDKGIEGLKLRELPVKFLKYNVCRTKDDEMKDTNISESLCTLCGKCGQYSQIKKVIEKGVVNEKIIRESLLCSKVDKIVVGDQVYSFKKFR